MPPIIQSCCCWKSLRHGSFACALYTGVYFTVSSAIMLHFICEEQLYRLENNTYYESVSFLESGSITYATLIFSFTVLTIGIFGLFSSIALVIGLVKNCKYLLLPWIFIMIVDSIVELLHCIHLFFVDTVEFNPVTAIIFTLDFFLVCLHTYALLCVISQFQIYSSARRSAEHERIININSQGPSIESRIVNTTPTVSTQGTFEPASVHYSTFTIETPRASSMRKTGIRVNKGVSFAEDTIVEAEPY